MGREQPATYYDRIFQEPSSHYAKPAAETPWFGIWRWIAEQVGEADRVLELGCGPGHLGAILSCAEYLGIDFSHAACAQAVARHGRPVLCAALPEALRWIDRESYDVVVACEFLEHIERDVDCLLPIRGERLIITLPKFDEMSHVRHFRTKDEAVDRYGQALGATAVDLGDHWGLAGTVTRCSKHDWHDYPCSLLAGHEGVCTHRFGDHAPDTK